jgi:HAD superfamily hydrolase (TIGR01509 family)
MRKKLWISHGVSGWRIEMFFFDLDGTLLDSTHVWIDIDTAFLGRHGISPVPPDYTDYVSHHSAPESARYTKERYQLPDSPEQIMDTWAEMAKTAYSQTLQLKPGVREFLQRCRQMNIRMGILTSCFPHLCHAALKHHGLSHLFEVVLTTNETGLEKGDGGLYRLALETCQVRPQDCTLFEDSPGYCAAAKQVGFHVVGLQDRMFASRQEELKALCGPGRYLTDFTSVIPEDFL